MKIKVNEDIYYINNHIFENIYDVLWSITKLCNQNCVYCFETLKNNKFKMSKEKKLSDYFLAINRLDSYDYKRIHFCGGEVLLKKNIFNIIKYIKNMECVLITNLSFVDTQLFELFSSQIVKRICVSLDSIDVNTNDYLRGNTNIIISNLLAVMKFIDDNCLSIEVDVLCTMTKMNLRYIKELLFWCKKNNINNVLLNPVSLTSKHPLYEELVFKFGEEDYLQTIEETFALKNKLFGIDQKDEIVLLLLQQVILHENVEIINCPTISTKKYLYIEENGEAFNCPLRKIYAGNIFENNLIYKKCNNSICKFSFQCLCYW